MKTKQKIIISIITILTVLSMNFLVLANSVKAASILNVSQVDLHSTGYCGQLLKRNGIILKTYYVEYTYNGKSYPAYCLDRPLTRSK